MSDAVTEQVIDALRAERDALKEHCNKSLVAALSMFETCYEHSQEIRAMGFTQFLEENPKGCNWCMKQQVEDLTRKLADATKYIQPS